MKLPWIVTSIIVGTISGCVAFYFSSHSKISVAIAVIVGVIAYISNPKKRYMKAFWVVLAVFVTLNKFFFKIVGNLLGIEFEVGSNNLPLLVNIMLLLLAGVLLLLDQLERRGKLKGKLFEINIVKNKNKIHKSSNNNYTYQQINNKSSQSKNDKPED